MPTKKQTETAFHQLGQVMRDLETDLCWRLKDSPRIPDAWHEIAQERVQPAKQKLTLRLDEDVVKFFRAMGQGHLTRMNAVLRAFMLARLAEVVKGEVEYRPIGAEEEPLSDEEQRFFDFVQWVAKQELSDEAKLHLVTQFMERERAGKG